MPIAVDSTTPVATSTSTTATTVQSGSFTPPAGSVVYVLWGGNTSTTAPSAPSITDSLASHLTWSLRNWRSLADSGGRNGQCAIWRAVVGSAPGSMTVTVTTGASSGDRQAAVQVIVLTGVDTTTPEVSDAEGSDSGGLDASSYTSAVAGSLGLQVASDWDASSSTFTAASGTTLLGSSTCGGSCNVAVMRQTTTGPAGTTVAMGLTSPTSTSWNFVRVEVRPAAGASATLGEPSESDTAAPLAKTKALAAGLPAEADTAATLAVGKAAAFGQPAETSTAFPVAAHKTITLGLPVETGQAFAVTTSADGGGATVDRLWPATDGPASDAGDYSAYTMAMQFSVSADAELTAIYWWRATPTSPPPTLCGVYDVATGTLLAPAETFDDPGSDTGWIKQTLTTPLPLTAAVNYKVAVFGNPIGYAATSGYWNTGGDGEGGRTSGIITAPDTSGADGGQDSFFSGTSMTYPNTNFGATNYWIDLEVTTGAGGPVTITLGQPAETDTAQPLTAAKARTTGQPAEADTAPAATLSKTITLGFTVALGLPVEDDTAQPFTAAKATAVGQPAESDSAAAIARAKSRGLGQPTETNTGSALAFVKTITLGVPVETDTALQVATSGEQVATLGQPAELDAAPSMLAGKTIILGIPVEADTAPAVHASGQTTITLGGPVEADTATALAPAKMLVLGLPVETSTAATLTRSKAAQLALALELDQALPFIGGVRRDITLTVTPLPARWAVTPLPARWASTPLEDE